MLEDLVKQRLTKSSEVVDVVTFATAPWGLNLRLFPAQEFILKAMHGLPFDRKEKKIKIYKDKFKERVERTLTEFEYLQFLKDEGRISASYEEGEERRETVLAIGRRGSKTRLSSVIVVYNIYKLLARYNPQEYYDVPEGDKIGFAAIATSQDQARELFAPVRAGVYHTSYIDKQLVRGSSDYELKLMSKHDLDAQGPKGMPSIQAMAYPCTARGVRGAANMIVVLDEFAHFVLTGGNRSDMEVYKAVTPSVSSFGDDGKIISISSPLSKAGKFYELFKLGMDKNPDILSIQAPCWEINEKLTPKVLKAEYSKDPDSYMNEYGAEWSGHVIDFIRDPDIFLRNVNPEREETKKGNYGQSYYMGLDVGVANDSTGIAIGHVEKGRIIVDLIEEIEPPGIIASREGIVLPDEESVLKLDDIADRIDTLCDLFNIQKGQYDSWNGYGLGEALSRVGRRQVFEMIHYTRALNSQIYKLLKQMLYENRIEFYPHEKFEKQFLRLQETKLSNHEIKVEAPSGEGHHDDLADAVVRAVHLCFDSMDLNAEPTMMASVNGMPLSPDGNGDLPATVSPSSVRLYHKRRRKYGGTNPRYERLAHLRQKGRKL